ncbi:hypothetical protein niasHS_001795 [Heterodera schachtii]|uniref:14-3-3 domain-containing protein n=1 Tax=Heterodera schachtii TaxID=97005 RepID=A0ABD2KAC1_HETSC
MINQFMCVSCDAKRPISIEFINKLNDLTSIEDLNAAQKKVANECILELQEELLAISRSALSIIDGKLLPNSTNEERICNLWLRADLLRYSCEHETVESFKSQAEAAFNVAKTEAEEKLRPENPIRIGIALNFGIFYERILKSKGLAHKIGKEAYDKAMAKQTRTPEANEKLEILNRNLQIWAS